MSKRKQYKLCYVDGNIMYFTDNFKNQDGDDWDDAPYEYNAGEPYEWVDEWTEEQNLKDRGHIRMIAYNSDRWLEYPCDGCCNSPYSVDLINRGATPWIKEHNGYPLRAGATMAEAKRWLKSIGAKWGELK